MSAGSSPAGRRGGPVILAAAAVIVAVVVAAGVLQPGSGGADVPPAGGPPAGDSVTVRPGGEERAPYDLAALRARPQATVGIAGKEPEGPLLRTLLEDAGIDRVAGVSVIGAGVRDGGRLALTAAQVDRGVQLDFSRRGTVKVCAPWLDRSEWVRDVISIDAE